MSKDNKTFFVSVPEVHYSHYKVLAKDADEARQKVAADTGDAELIDTVFSHLYDDHCFNWSYEEGEGNSVDGEKVDDNE